MELHKSDVNVESFVDSCVSIFHTPARGKDITIKMELCDESVDSSIGVNKTDLLSIDKFKMSQVLRNFLSNALKFTPDGGTITVRACFIPVETIETNVTTSNDEKTTKKDYKRGSIMSEKWLLPVLRLKPTQSQKSLSTIDAVACVDVEIGGLSDQKVGNLAGDVHTVQKGMLRISVTDSGAGISPENQKRLFKEIIQFNPEILQGTLMYPFNLSHRILSHTLSTYLVLIRLLDLSHTCISSLAGGGSGFGLYICAGIVDLHQGSINVFSKGTQSINTL